MLPSNSGEVTQGTGCAVFKTDCDAEYSVPGILVLNCGAYNAYYLKPTKSSVAYCISNV